MNGDEVNEDWKQSSDLTIYEAAFWMRLDSDPKLHKYFVDHIPGYNGDSYIYERGLDVDIWDKCEVLLSAIRSGLIKTTKESISEDGSLKCEQTYILKDHWLKWCNETKEYKNLAAKFDFDSLGHLPDIVVAATEVVNHEQPDPLPPYVTTKELVGCFGGHMGVKNPAKVLSEYPVWARKDGALVHRGRRGKPSKTTPAISEWNPVQFAINLLDKRPLPVIDGIGELMQHHLDTVFGYKSLDSWKPIWRKEKPR